MGMVSPGEEVGWSAHIGTPLHNREQYTAMQYSSVSCITVRPGAGYRGYISSWPVSATSRELRNLSTLDRDAVQHAVGLVHSSGGSWLLCGDPSTSQ